VTIQTGAFDDSSNRAQRFYGVYVSKALGKAASLDVYAFELDRDGVRFGAVRGDERRASYGARLAGKRGAIDYEPRAYPGRSVRRSRHPRLGRQRGRRLHLSRPGRRGWVCGSTPARATSDPGDDELGTFNPLFPKGSYFNETGLTSWSNLVAVRPSLGLAPAAMSALS
jgi:hypothetical protein